jgi:hypothetical protein
LGRCSTLSQGWVIKGGSAINRVLLPDTDAVDQPVGIGIVARVQSHLVGADLGEGLGARGRTAGRRHGVAGPVTAEGIGEDQLMVLEVPVEVAAGEDGVRNSELADVWLCGF